MPFRIKLCTPLRDSRILPFFLFPSHGRPFRPFKITYFLLLSMDFQHEYQMAPNHFRQKLNFCFGDNLREIYFLGFNYINYPSSPPFFFVFLSGGFKVNCDQLCFTATRTFPTQQHFSILRRTVIFSAWLFSHCKSISASFMFSRILYLWVVSLQVYHLQSTQHFLIFFFQMCSFPINQTPKSLRANLVNKLLYFPS